MSSDKCDDCYDEHSASEFAKPTRQSSWNRALVLDPESGCVDVQRESDIDTGQCILMILCGTAANADFTSRVPETAA